MTESLIDEEGYPRSDVDVYQIRHIRSQISRRLNDHKLIMKELERQLHHLHSIKKNTSSTKTNLTPSQSTLDNISSDKSSNQSHHTTDFSHPRIPNERIAFALVKAVAPDSPANYAVNILVMMETLTHTHTRKKKNEKKNNKKELTIIWIYKLTSTALFWFMINSTFDELGYAER